VDSKNRQEVGSVDFFANGILQDRIALVTGGGTGIGKATAIEMAKVGAHIAVTGRTKETLEGTVEAVQKLGRRAIAVPCDVREAEQVEVMAQRVKEEFGRIDILVNSAGALFRATAEEMSINAWNSLIRINLNAQFYCCQAVGKIMIEQGGGKIINVSSEAPFKGTPMSPHNAAARGGLHALSKSLALGWAKYNILVNDIAPGMIATDVVMDRIVPSKDAYEEIVQGIPLKRFGTPEEIAYIAVFLASDAANFITGVILPVDGGDWLTSARSGLSSHHD
jgi:NAD(P)-dependent dehydrogenase (short-subunit alcohol dehydrogenase family)